MDGGMKDDAGIGKFKRWFQADCSHSAQWRRDAREAYKFYAGEQWSDKDKTALQEQGRPHVCFNRILPTINAVSGAEITNRQEIRFVPREKDDQNLSDIVTAAAKWYRDMADAEDEESDAFKDALICGMGWLEERIDYEEDPDGHPRCDRLDPFEMLWDCEARKPNLDDASRIWRVRDMPLEEAKALFPGKKPGDLHAGWAAGYMEDGREPNDNDPRHEYQDDDSDADGDTRERVTIVECQWIEKANFHRVRVPDTEEITELSEEDFGKVTKEAEAMGLPPVESVPQIKRLVKRAFFGRIMLQGPEDAPCPTHFTFQCITGQRDQISGTWYGLVKPMIDPQRWANKFFSQILHIINTSAKGGVMVEQDAIPDARDFEESWARTDAVTTLRPGAISSGKIQPKPVSQIPPALPAMMEYAIQSIRDASGVNNELLGLRDANQPGVLEYQRKQAGLTIIASFFDSLRRYRKKAGRVILYYIQNYLSDERMIRIVGAEGEQHVPLSREKTIGKYDVVVDEASTAPSVKERTWQFISPMFMNLPPQIQAALIDYSPLPTSVVEKVKEAMQGLMQPGPEQQAQVQLALAELQAKVEKLQAETQKIQAETRGGAMKTAADAQKTVAETTKLMMAPATPPAMPGAVNGGIA